MGDEEVIRASIEHPQRFETIFDGHHRVIWRYLARGGGSEHADELASEVFLVAFASRDRYDPSRGSVRAWLYGIATNLARTRLRGEERRARAFKRASLERLPAVQPTAEQDDLAAMKEQLTAVIDALADLPSRDREVIVLYAWERLTYEEIAAALGVELGTVRSRLARARGRLRELVGVSGEFT